MSCVCGMVNGESAAPSSMSEYNTAPVILLPGAILCASVCVYVCVFVFARTYACANSSPIKHMSTKLTNFALAETHN